MKIAFYKYSKDDPFLKTFSDRIISWWTKGPYSHAELILEHKGDNLYTCASSSIRDKGIRIKDINLNSDKWDILELNLPDEKKILAKEWFLKNLGKSYDNLALLGFLLRVVDGEKEKFFCSEAICESLGITESWRFDPNALYNLILCINRLYHV